MCCSYYARPGLNEGKRDFQRFLPTAGDIHFLVIGWIVILGLVGVINIYQIVKLWVIADVDSMEVNFIEKFIDDPLSYCPMWDHQCPKYSQHMSRATISEEPAPIKEKSD